MSNTFEFQEAYRNFVKKYNDASNHFNSLQMWAKRLPNVEKAELDILWDMRDSLDEFDEDFFKLFKILKKKGVVSSVKG